ncbi:DUF3613 domain-containing protein [Paraburkholderia metrosideri]|uniref:DUF3613 domain-containing protein n=1 Tax=Paraburkholderia metrosideri TaxID=580937 RepID=A0ABM8N900_9BURK|nr:DUF3613 domain-containing protein [Paraburkholderia metrosideri]CAD6508982.1 hypothetical protein LMG28140_00204 [Paraburkholderia metrosideri]
MTKTNMTRGWNASMLCFGVAVAVVLGTPALAVAQTAADAEPAQGAAQASAQDAAQASAQDAQPVVLVSEIGHSTRAWLDLQRSNTQAAPMLPTLGTEAGLAYRRYMESFNSKIPDLYGSALSGGGSSGGGSGGAAGNTGGLN